MQRQKTISWLRLAAWIFLSAVSLLIASEQQRIGAIQLNAAALAQAKELVNQGRAVADGKGAWLKHRPSAEAENEFIRLRGYGEYAKWFLAIDTQHGENSKARYKFPYGDFVTVHRCALLAAQTRAAQYKYAHIENAAARLRAAIEAKAAEQRGR
jgi:hypothetical protein